jgi:hypothetical protein
VDIEKREETGAVFINGEHLMRTWGGYHELVAETPDGRRVVGRTLLGSVPDGMTFELVAAQPR